MILSVTLNPCLDKTLSVPAWKPGDNVRGTELREVVGGKGNNVARALRRLGREVRPATFFGGAVGTHCETLLRRDDGLDPIAVATEAPTRVILTVRTASNDQTAFFDPDPEIRRDEAEALHRALETQVKSGRIEAMTLSGSSPSAETHGLFGDLIALARSRRVPVFLDTYGPALEGIWGFWPDVLQVNRKEAAAHLGLDQAGDDDVLRLLAEWSRHKVKIALATSGADPVLAVAGGAVFRVVPPTIAPVNPIGSGDCVLAGLTHARLGGMDPEATLKFAIACGVANALTWDAGAIDPEVVARTADEVRVERI